MGSHFRDNWYHGTASRQHVEDLVKKAGKNGSYAVRCSESVPGAYTISLLSKGRVYTYRALPTNGKLSVQTNDGVQRRKFNSIDDLVLEYRKSGNGLACGLTNPVGKPISEIRPDLPPRNTQPSALTMPLPPVPGNTPQPPYSAAVNGQNTNFNPVGILAAVSAPTVGPQSTLYPSAQLHSVTPSAPPPLPDRTPPSAPHPVPETMPVVTQGAPTPTESPQQQCVICMDQKVNAFFQSCGHLCCCMDCSKEIRECPLCRKKISKAQKAYLP